jgi:hypothetical protein
MCTDMMLRSWAVFLLSGSRLLPSWVFPVIVLDASVRIFSCDSSCLVQVSIQPVSESDLVLDGGIAADINYVGR